MKKEILKIAQALEADIITETEAHNLLLGLFGVVKSVCECADRHEEGIVWSAKTGRYLECKCKRTVL